MQLLKNIDPRDDLARARKSDIVRFVKANGIPEIHPEMPGELMKAILRQKGITRVPIANPQMLGAIPYRADVPAPETVIETDAVTDLRRQWEKQRNQIAERDKPLEAKWNEVARLRRECKRRGITLKRTDKVADLMRYLEA